MKSLIVSLHRLPTRFFIRLVAAIAMIAATNLYSVQAQQPPPYSDVLSCKDSLIWLNESASTADQFRNLYHDGRNLDDMDESLRSVSNSLIGIISSKDRVSLRIVNDTLDSCADEPIGITLAYILMLQDEVMLSVATSLVSQDDDRYDLFQRAVVRRREQIINFSLSYPTYEDISGLNRINEFIK